MTEKVTFIPIAPVRINLYTINWKNWTADASGPWFYFYVFSLSHTKMFFCSHYPPRIIYSRLQLWAKNIQLWQNDTKTRSSRNKKFHPNLSARTKLNWARFKRFISPCVFLEEKLSQCWKNIGEIIHFPQEICIK